MKTIVGLYDNLGTAQRVVQDLVNSGFNRQSISLITPEQTQDYGKYADTGASSGSMETKGDSHVPEGAGAGAVIGGLGGLLVGLGALAIPGIGPIVAAGPLAAALVGAGVGAVAGGLIGALVDMGIPEDEANVYAEGVRQGRSMVAVAAEENRVDKAVDIMERYDPIDIDKMAQQWRASGWTGQAVGGQRPTSTASAAQTSPSDIRRSETAYADRSRTTGDVEESIPVIEEEVKVGKREVQKGKVRIHSYVREVPVEEEVRLREERVNVERQPVNRPASSDDLDAFQERTIEVTERAEEPVVSKQAQVVEEVRVNKDVAERTETVHETARRTEVEVENAGVSGKRNFQSFDPGFRRHFETNYRSSGHDYNYYQPAYRYGYAVAGESSYRGRNWNDIEPEVRRRWERDNTSAWDDVKDAVRNAWESTKDAVSGR